MTTHYPNGVTTAAKGSTLGEFILPDPTKAHVFFDDFDSYAAGDWVITTTEAGGGSASEALEDADGGVLVITNDAADDDNDFLQWAGGAGNAIEAWKFEATKKLWFKARVKLSDATQSDFVIGLQITDTSPLAVSDGVYLQSDDGDANLDCHVTKDSTSTSSAAASTLSDDTWCTLGFFYNGSDEVVFYKDDSKIASLATTNLPDDEELAISFGLQNGAAAAKILRLDYLFVAKER